MEEGRRAGRRVPGSGERAGEHRRAAEVRAAVAPRRRRRPGRRGAHDGGHLIYFDHNASTPVRPEVAEAMTAGLGDLYANPSSMHREGQRARAAIERAREQVAALVNADSGEVVFTSGGT
ncbi:MAG: aminotransferase class V-fold PLP-dependent enzyme, partial [Candidatus Eisenbacteria bacterium]